MKISANKNLKNTNKLNSLTKLTPLPVALLLLGTFTPVKAEETSSRYEMMESKNGVIRLDKKTGSMSNCKKSSEGWTCSPVKELTTNGSETENALENESLLSELQKENEALHKENKSLKQKVADLEFGLNGKQTDKKFNLPSDKEVDEAITYMEKMIRKFGGAMKRLREKQSDATEQEL